MNLINAICAAPFVWLAWALYRIIAAAVAGSHHRSPKEG